MRSVRGPRAVLAALPLVVAAVLGAPGPVVAAPSDAPSDASSAAVARSTSQVVLRAGAPAPPTAVRPAAAEAARAAAVTFQVTYTGFSTEARSAFQRAVDLWAPLITSPVPITVDARFATLGTGVLGSAGPGLVHKNFTGAPRRDTWYPDAIANRRAGRQLHPSADILARFNSSRTDWHFGSGPAPAGRIDFTTVVMHELGHGLGFLGAGRVDSSGRGTVRLDSSPRLPTAYDHFTENGAGTSLLSGFPDLSAQLATQLRSGNLYFDSAQVRNANGGARARIHAPATFQPGSSYSHLNEATYPPGTANSLMTPVLNAGETVRSPGPITRAIFASTGW